MICGPYLARTPFFHLDIANTLSWTASTLTDIISSSTASFFGGNPTFSSLYLGTLQFTQSIATFSSPSLASQTGDLTLQAFVKFDNLHLSRQIILANTELGTTQSKGFSFYLDRFGSESLNERALRFKFGRESVGWNLWGSQKHSVLHQDRWYGLAVTATGLNSSSPNINFWLNDEQLGATHSGTKATYSVSNLPIRLAGESLSATQSWTSSFSTGVILAYPKVLSQDEITRNWTAFRTRYPDQKSAFMAGGNFTAYGLINDDTRLESIVKLNLSGSINQKVQSGFNKGAFFSIKTNDDKFLVCGDFTQYGGVTHSRIVKLNKDLSVDTQFNSGVGFNAVVNCLSLDPSSNSFYACGNFTQYNGTTASRIIRLTATGSVDASFNTGTGFNGNVLKIICDSQGRIIAGGTFSSYNGTTATRIARVLSTGAIDTLFTNQTVGFNNAVWSLELDSSDRVWCVGDFTSYNSTTYNRMVVLQSDSTVWTGITYSTGFNNGVYLVKKLTDGKFLLSGLFTTYKGVSYTRIVKLTSSGDVDTSFNAGSGLDSYAFTVAELADNSLVLGGLFDTYNNQLTSKLTRVSATGSIVAGFTQSYFNGLVRNVILDNSLLYVSGQFSSYVTTAGNRLFKYLDGNEIDSEFNIGTGFNGVIREIRGWKDKYLVCGQYTQFNGVTSSSMDMMTSTGSRISSFDTKFQFSPAAQVLCIETTSSGEIYAGGLFTQYDSKPAPTLIRINEYGQKLTPDVVSFPGYGANNTTVRIKIDFEDKLLISGLFTAYGTYSVVRFGRIMPNSLLPDTTFDGGAGITINSNNLGNIDIDRQGRYIVTGDLATYKGTSIGRIVRIDRSGNLDATFNTGTGFNSTTFGSLVQDDGKIVVWGNFTSYNGTEANYIIRLNENGSIDNTFNTGDGFSGFVRTGFLDKDGKITLGGLFTRYNYQPVSNIVRLNPDGTIDTSFTIAVNNVVWFVNAV